MKVGLVVFFCFFVTPAHADLYKCISAGGGVTYSDTPCPVTTNATQKNSRVISTSKINTFNVSPDQVAQAQAIAQKDIDAVALRETMSKLSPLSQRQLLFNKVDAANKARLATEGNLAVQGMEGSAKRPFTPMPVQSNPQPSVITNCDSGGCWDNIGGRYNRGAGNTFFGPSGKACQMLGSQMHCP